MSNSKISAQLAANILSGDESQVLTPEQINAIENASTSTPSLVVAGAGSGKTQLMAIRVVWLVANQKCLPEEILGLTFTRKAASELSTRINNALEVLSESEYWPFEDRSFASPMITTYNAYANTLYRDYALALGYEDDAALLTDGARFQLARDVVLKYGEEVDENISDNDLRLEDLVDAVLNLAGAMNDHGVTASEITSHVHGFTETIASKDPGRAKVSAEQPIGVTLAKEIKNVYSTPLIAALAERFIEEKRVRGYIDFSDQVALANRAVRDLGDSVRDRELELHKQILLDEYQDTSSLQNELLSGIYKGKSVLAVGDPNQSIYGWRGASASNLADFLVDFQAPGLEIIQYPLDRSWRNPKIVLDLANKILEPLLTPASFAAGRNIPEVHVSPLQPSYKAIDGKLTVNFADDVSTEAKYVASWLKERIWVEGESKPPTAAVLFRTRNQMVVFETELREAGLEVEVVGLGGLLEAPEIVDLVSALKVVHSPNAGAYLMRLLTGPRWQITPKDLERLSRYSKNLAKFWFKSDSKVSGAEAEASLIDALDYLLDEEDQDLLPDFTERGLAALRDCAALLKRLRSRTGLPLPEFVRAVEQELWLDIELAANPRRQDPMANLNAFANLAIGFNETNSATLGSFLEWLEYAEKKERFDPPASKAKAGVVQLITSHTAKGLEWDLVVVPRLVTSSRLLTSNFPSMNDKKGWLNLGAMPYQLRGDSNSLPVIDLSGCDTQTEVTKAIDSFKDDVYEYQLREERRMAYVAFTRPRRELLLTGSKWKPGVATPLSPSPFLLEAASLNDPRVEVIDHTGDADNPLPLHEDLVENPTDKAAIQEVWPLEPLGEKHRPKVMKAKELVEHAMEVAAPSRTAMDEKIDRLFAERDEALNRSHQVKLPVRIPASRFKEFVYDLPKTAERYRRPMPEQPYKQTMAGTLFHSWVEARFGVLANSDELDAVELEIEDEATSKTMEELQAMFEGSRFSGMKPFSIEGEIQVTIKGNTFICKLDAVFETETGYEIVDWKTGKPPVGEKEIAERALQLALYRMAFSKLHGVEPSKIEVCLYYVSEDLEIKPEEVPSEVELFALWDSVLEQVED